MKWRIFPAVVALLASCLHLYSADQEVLVLKKDDHIAVIGNALADRMQHDGWLQTLIYRANPNLDLTFRNLAFSCDEVVTRLITDTGASRSQWLARTHADVVLAFFGFNESFAGPEGLPRFKQELEGFIKETLVANYSGNGAPRLVLFSPIAEEKMPDPNLASPVANNANLSAYTAAMAEVAKANHVQFVDLFTLTQQLYATNKQPLTFNGIHLTEAGDRILAPLMFTAMFGVNPPVASASIESLRAAVVDKNETWHSRYRTVDSFNIYGGRSGLAYESGRNGPLVTNATIMLEEMAQRDVMTANRDKHVWSVAKGAPIKIDDSNLPPVTQIKSNHLGANADGSHVYLSGEEAIKHMTVPKGFKVTLFASEEQFPELINPVQMNWDTKGRLWVSAWQNYPERTPTSTDGDKILIFEDTKGVGKADKMTVFIGGLNCPTGFQFYKDGILLMESPDLWWVRDTSGRGKADWKERVLMGLDAADSHHETNSMVLDPGGATYLSDGVFMRTQVETAYGPVRNNDAAIYRYEPASQKFERYVAYGFANPHGRVFDYWGTDIISDASGNENFFGPAFSGHIDYPQKHDHMEQFWARNSRPCSGTGILSSRAFPEEYQGNFLNCNVISMQGIFRVKVTEDGSGLKGETLENLISSDDPNFRPTGVSVAPDGSLYVLDWSNDIIGHMQHHLRDPNRDHKHGRIYRITYEGLPLLKPAKIDGASMSTLLEQLKVPENDVRIRAKLEMSKHDTAEVISALDKWVAGLDEKDANFPHNLTEALWVHQWQNVVDIPLLKRVLHSSDYHARAAAIRVLCYWRDRVPEALTLLKEMAEDEQPWVRLEVVRTCSFFTQWEAADVALEVLKRPMDYYLTYCLKETMRQLTPWWKDAISAGKPLAADNPKGVEYVLADVKTADLASLPKSDNVYLAMFDRSDAPLSMRQQALQALAKMRNQTPFATLMNLIGILATSEGPALTEACHMLVNQPAGDLLAGRDSLLKLVQPGNAKDVRLAVIAALIIADGSVDKQWTEADASAAKITDVLESVMLVPEAKIRATAAAKILPLLDVTLPAPIAASLATQKANDARYVRVELPHAGPLTLAEVQVFSGNTNIALKCKASQSSTAYGGDAQRAVDGNTAGDFGAGSCTHTNEGEPNPWWEVDLGKELPIDSVVLWNRTDADYYHRLEGATVVLLDASHHELSRSAPYPATKEPLHVHLSGDPKATFRRAAIEASVVCGGDAHVIFTALAQLMAHGEQIPAAAAAVMQLPRDSWNKDAASAAANGILTWVKTIPVDHRTDADVAEAIGVARELTGILPAEEAKAVLKGLHEVGVNVYTLNTVREQMKFDLPRIVVEAGKPFEIIFHNPDAMPHNLVIVAPGSRERIGMAAMTLPPKPDENGLTYVPKDKAVLAATRLVDPGHTETLRMTAPAEEEECQFVCTFPGHYMLMWGKLIVTKDVDAYLQAHPK
jgi:glucose/arabinose dehydrogenase/azurin/lysophospholipase L1-like esterase